MPVVPVSSLDEPRLAWYRGVSDPRLLHEGGRFVAEGRAVVSRLLASPRWVIESVLVTPAALRAIEPALASRPADVTVFVTEVDALVALAGFNIHRGCLAIGMRGELPAADQLVDAPSAGLWLGLEGLADPDNVGACFRNAAAFGARAVLLDDACADPLYRKSIRTSMGATLQVPFARVGTWREALDPLRQTGVTTVALTPAAGADPLPDVAAALADAGRVLLLVGSEGHGLRPETIAVCDMRVRIPIAPGVDSLNVATAAGIALFALGARLRRPYRR